MNCRRFQSLLLDYLESSLPPARRDSAERHLAECCACRQVWREYQALSQFLSEGFRREAASIAFAAEDQRQLIAVLQQPSLHIPVAHPLSGWWRRLAWCGAGAAAVVMGFCLITGFPSRSPRHGSPEPTAQADVPDVRMLMQFSYCQPNYIFRRQADLVLDSVSCEPRTVEQTLWVAQHEKPAASATKSPL